MPDEIQQPEPTLIANVKLTEQQATQALINFVFINEEVKELVGDKKVVVLPRWQTTKWSDQDYLLHIDIVEPILDTDKGEIDEVNAPGETDEA